MNSLLHHTAWRAHVKNVKCGSSLLQQSLPRILETDQTLLILGFLHYDKYMQVNIKKNSDNFPINKNVLSLKKIVIMTLKMYTVLYIKL